MRSNEAAIVSTGPLFELFVLNGKVGCSNLVPHKRKENTQVEPAGGGPVRRRVPITGWQRHCWKKKIVELRTIPKGGKNVRKLQQADR